ncbi:MAG: transposase [Sphingobacteriales bacterium]|nr:transposase [Sphingobacteriales bacterium]
MHRIIKIDDKNISFRYKDYQDARLNDKVGQDNKQKVMTLGHAEFLRRFEQHILPKGFVKIRHAGYLHSKDKMKRIAEVCKQLQLPKPMPGSHTRHRKTAATDGERRNGMPGMRQGETAISTHPDVS